MKKPRVNATQERPQVVSVRPWGRPSDAGWLAEDLALRVEGPGKTRAVRVLEERALCHGRDPCGVIT